MEIVAKWKDWIQCVEAGSFLNQLDQLDQLDEVLLLYFAKGN